MNSIGSLLGVPPGGWGHGQSRLFERGDIRLVWLLRRLASRPAAQRVAKNLERAAGLSGAGTMLTIATTAREHSSALTDVSSRMIDSWHEGGLDFLWKEKDRLGLPRSVTGAWTTVEPFVSEETNHHVFPAYIPAHDQLLVYAAQIRASFDHSFIPHLADIAGNAAGTRLAATSRPALLVWKAYSFLAPGGKPYDPKTTIAAQSGQKFGCRTAIETVAPSRGGAIDLDDVLRLPDLISVEWCEVLKFAPRKRYFSSGY